MADPIPRGPFDQGLFLTHYNKGRELFEARRFEEAERQLEEAYLLRPRDPRVLNLLGLVYYRSDKLGKAEEVYRKLIAESPEAHTLHYNLGLVCFKLGRLDEAETAFVKAVELTQGNPKIHFYLGSIYERQQRYKDAIYQYRHAGAHMLVQRLEGRIGGKAQDATAPPSLRVPTAPATPPAESDDGPGTRPPQSRAVPAPAPAPSPAAAPAEPAPPGKTVEPVSPTLMAGDSPLPGLHATRRFQGYEDDTLPPGMRAISVAAARAAAAPAQEPRPQAPAREAFRGLEKGLMEIEFSGKVYIKQGTIYSYSGNLTFWVKDKRPGARPSLVIVTGTGRLILTDQDRDLTFMQVADEPVYVEPAHLLACEEGLQPRYIRLGDEAAGTRGGGPRRPRHARALGREQAAAAERRTRRSRLGARALGDHVDGRARAARRRRSRGLRGRDGALRLARADGPARRARVGSSSSRRRGRTRNGPERNGPTDSLDRLSGALIAPRTPRCHTHCRAIGPITGSSNSSPELALIISSTSTASRPRPTIVSTRLSSRPTSPRPARPRPVWTMTTPHISTKIAPCSSRLWNAWKRTKRLCFSTIAATTANTKPMQHGT